MQKETSGIGQRTASGRAHGEKPIEQNLFLETGTAGKKFTWECENLLRYDFSVTGLKLGFKNALGKDNCRIRATVINQDWARSFEIYDGKTPSDFIDAIVFRHEGVLPLMPGKNTVMLVAYKENEGVVASKSFEVNGDGRRYLQGKISINVENGVEKAPTLPLMEHLAQVVSKQNILLADEFKVRNMIFTNEKENSARLKGQDIWLSGAYANADKNLTERVVLHETTHSFVYQLKSKKPALAKYFEGKFNELDRFGKFSDATDIKTTEGFRVFDESTYAEDIAKRTGTSGGHPYSNSEELFASASTVLQKFPAQFLSQLERLSKEEKNLAKEIAKFVISRYLENPNCPKNMFSAELIKKMWE